jgi:hypothetical protein
MLQKRFSAILVPCIGLVLSGCSLITNVDRTKIDDRTPGGSDAGGSDAGGNTGTTGGGTGGAAGGAGGAGGSS